MTNGSSPAGWYQDPTGQGDGRYWNGVSWTELVDRGGVTVDVPIDPSQAQVPPTPGTQVSIPQPAPATETYDLPPQRRSPWGAILGVIVVVLLVVVVIVIVSNDDSSDDSPTPGTTPAAPATEAPAAPATGG